MVALARAWTRLIVEFFLGSRCDPADIAARLHAEIGEGVGDLAGCNRDASVFKSYSGTARRQLALKRS